MIPDNHRQAVARRKRIAGPLFAALTIPATAAAAFNIPIDGVYGTKEGCEYHRTLDWTGSDGIFLLLRDHIEMPDYACRFTRLTDANETRIEAWAICRHDPVEDVPVEPQRVTKVEMQRSGDGYVVTFGDGMSWGPLAKC
jgi:hypothetical protein